MEIRKHYKLAHHTPMHTLVKLLIYLRATARDILEPTAENISL